MPWYENMLLQNEVFNAVKQIKAGIVNETIAVTHQAQ